MRQQAKYQRQCSPLRHLGQGEVDTIAGFSWSLDGTIHVILVERLAVTYRDPDAIALLQVVASAARNSRKYPYRQKDAELAATQFRMRTMCGGRCRLGWRSPGRWHVSVNKPSAASGLKSLCGSGCTVGWRIWTPPKMTCTDWPPTWPRGYLVSHRGRPLIEAAETRGRDGKVVPIGIAQEKTPVWRGAARPKAKSTRRIRTWNWGQQMAFVNHFYFYLWAPDWGGAFWKTSASRRFCDPADRLRGDGHDPRQLGAEQTRTPRPYPVGGDGLRKPDWWCPVRRS